MKKEIRKTLNNHGSTLQIVLITFLIMSFALTSCLFLMKAKVTNYQQIDILMKQKNLEIFLTEYYVMQMENSILFSDYYEKDNYRIQSYVDDMGSFYEITTRIESSFMNYQFLIQIDVDNYQVLKFEYVEV